MGTHIQYGYAFGQSFEEEGICGSAGVEITPEYCARLGGAIGSLKGDGPVAVGSTQDRAAAALCRVIASAIQGAGRDVLELKSGALPLFVHQVTAYQGALGVFLQGESGSPSACWIGMDCLPDVRWSVRWRGPCCGGSSRGGTPGSFGRLFSVGESGLLYANRLKRLAPQGLGGLRLQLRCDNPILQRLGEEILSGLGAPGDPRRHEPHLSDQ